MAAVRETWIDTAKGIAIILVVLYHSVIFMNDVGLASFWIPVSGLMDTFRMPLFFFTAGIFAAKAIRLPFADLFRSRVARLLWLYLLWSLIWVVVFQFVPTAHDGGPTWLGFLLIPVWPNSSTWFVYALALFFIAAWLMRSWPVWVQFVPGLVLTLLFGTRLLSTGSEPLDKMAMYFVFFIAAVHGGAAARRIAPRARVWHVLALGALYGAVATLITITDAERIPGIRLAASALAIALGCALAIVLGRLRMFRWLTTLGTRTLPIYLIHFYPILFTAALLEPIAPTLRRYAIVVPPLMTVLAILVALGFWLLTRGIPGLYGLPGRANRRRLVTEARP